MSDHKPRLLHETAEIALTQIKRFVEPRLEEKLNLRRVSAPMFLPVGSPMLSPEYPGVRVRLEGSRAEVEIVGDLSRWLRHQLTVYDAAAGFGVYTVMNALRPEVVPSATASPHVAAWSWQQVLESPEALTSRTLTERTLTLYRLLVDTECTILLTFPHLRATLPEHPEVATLQALRERCPGCDDRRLVYDHLHPHREPSLRESLAGRTLSETDHSLRAMLLIDGSHCSLLAWNHIIGRPVLLAETHLYPADDLGRPSIGGTIYRSGVALQLLHLDHIL